MEEPIISPAILAEGRTIEGSSFPLTLMPADRRQRISAGQLAAWVHRQRDALLASAMKHGAVLLRGFGLSGAKDFARVYHAFHFEAMPYVGGAAVRHPVIGDQIFTANESPPSEPIPFHHEMAQVPNPPAYVVFYCDQAPAAGGETPIILSNQVYRYFNSRHPQLCRKAEALGVRYVRVMPEQDDPGSAIGRSWKSTFQVQTRAQAEQQMRKLGTEWEWQPGGDLKTVTQVVPAIRQDPRTGQNVFFNSMVAAFTGWIDRRNDPRKAVMLGDGSLLDEAAMLDLVSFMRSSSVAFAWQPGDILLVDNWTTMHSRNPFSPPRQILAAIGRKALPISQPQPAKVPLHSEVALTTEAE